MTTTPPMPHPAPDFRAQLLAGHDGDTTCFLVDKWDGDWRRMQVRYADVRAPEVKPMQPGGAETRAYVNGWLAAVVSRNSSTRHPLTSPFVIRCQVTSGTEPDVRLTFSRAVGWVYDASTGACLNDAVNAFLAEHPDWPSGKALDQLAVVEHDYLSTGCLHGRHDYCQAPTGAVGVKAPAKCKFCNAQCKCTCHREG